MRIMASNFFILALTFILCGKTGCQNLQVDPSIHTIVIGGGVSGMASALQIAKQGHYVVVLEANDYTGGRIKTRSVQLADGSLFQFEEGANWIHGSNPSHPITQLSKSISGVKFVETDDSSILNLSESGENITYIVDQQYTAYAKMAENIQKITGVSVQEAFSQLDSSKLKNSRFMSHVSNDIEFQTASPIDQVSARYYADDQAYSGQQLLVVSGYQQFVTYLSQNQNIRVLLNHQVLQVTYDGTSTLVSCLNGQVFIAKNIVIAVPLGVLKSGSIQFTPNLPLWKSEAIQKIHFGDVCKILIVLKDKLIQREQHYIGVIPNDVNQRGNAAYFLNIKALTGLPALMTFGLGPNAEQLENLPQAQLKNTIASRLSVISNSSFTAEDFEIRRSSWSSNPNFRGAYSASGVSTLRRHWRSMAKPVFQTKWFFCGEHTNSIHRGTVHGAFQSGIQTATDILNQVDESDWEYKFQ